MQRQNAAQNFSLLWHSSRALGLYFCVVHILCAASSPELFSQTGQYAQVKKIPYLIVLGKNEAAEGTVSYRLHGEQKSTTVSKDEFVAMLKDEIATKKNNPAAAK